MEAQLVDHFTVAELAALARFYGTPEGRSLARKGLAFTAAVTPDARGRARRGRGVFRRPAATRRSGPVTAIVVSRPAR
jgi:hypothetical protein